MRQNNSFQILIIDSIAQFKNRVRMNLEQSRQSRIRQSLKRKFYENDTENPLGKYKLIMNDYHKRQAFLTLGPNYIIFCLLFLAVNLSTIFVIYKIGKSEDFRAFFLILTVATVLLDVAWLVTALINPGISTANFEEVGDYCELCQANNDMEVVKKAGRFHCLQCDVCIDQQESHFKVIGGCVGKNNFIAFKFLILGVFIWGLSMLTIVPLVYNI